MLLHISCICIYCIYIYMCVCVLNIYMCVCVCIIHIYIYCIYDSKSLDVVQSLYFGSKLPSSGTYK